MSKRVIPLWFISKWINVALIVYRQMDQFWPFGLSPVTGLIPVCFIFEWISFALIGNKGDCG